MGRKLKYKDVVKSGPPDAGKKSGRSHKKSLKSNGKNKFSGVFKQRSNLKRKREFDHDTKKSENKKRPKVVFEEEPPVAKVPLHLLSDSEGDSEEEPDPLTLLRESFGIKTSQAITSSESEDELDDTSLPEGVSVNKTENSVESDEEADGNVDDNEVDDTEEINELDNNAQLEDNSDDPFVKHVYYELHPALLEALEVKPPPVEMHEVNWSRLGTVIVQIPKCEISKATDHSNIDNTIYALPGSVPKKIDSNSTCEKLFIKSQIAHNLSAANESLPNGGNGLFTPLQQELFSIVNEYQDLYYPERSLENEDEIRFVYCLHAINHVLKTRTKVVHHNTKLLKRDDVPEEFRDQGLARPKVLIVTPFKHSAYKIINTMIKIMFKDDKGIVMSKKRFEDDYTGNALHFPKKNPKPEDYEKIFAGNTSDSFRIGLSFTKKTIKLYSNFYSSDIIVASPLGLRTVIGAEGEPDRDYDFLTSIELLILDQPEIFLMQNWDHINHLFKHMHLHPKDKTFHGTDVFRVRQWCLNMWSKYYRQTLIFSSSILPEFYSIFNSRCTNFAGKVIIANPVENGSINEVFVPLTHCFQRFNANSAADAIDRRFNFFKSTVLPYYREEGMKQTLIFFPSYFDFVRVRNYFKKESASFVQICEYSKDKKVARARDIFYHGDARFLLYTERHHFYHRIRVKGIRHLVFYQLPNWPKFYAEIANLMQELNMNKKVGRSDCMTVTALYSKFDKFHLAGVVGTEKAKEMAQSSEDIHKIRTGFK